MTARLAFWPTTLKRFWPKSWKPYCPAILQTPVRDYYDIYILYALRGAECDKATLRRALERTTEKRGSGKILTQYPEIMQEIRGSDILRKQWNKYSREYDYAKDISFDDTCNAIQKIMDETIT